MKRLGINPESMAELIDRVHQFQAQDMVGALGDGSEPDGSNPALAELRFALEDLDPDQQIDLVALMWLGRGDYTVEEWESARDDATSRWTTTTAEYLIGTPLLADYWTEALGLLENADEDG